MTKRKLLTREAIGAESWGAAYLREMDLVIASNVLQSLSTGQTLYNRSLNGMVAERCIPLDGGLVERKLDVIRVAPNDEEPYRRVPDALKSLQGTPRGHWAALEKDGRYDAYMSDGYGGIGTESGQKFRYLSPDAPDLAFNAVYGSVVSPAVYLRRNEIEGEIMDYSFRAADVRSGQVFHDLWLNGKAYGKVEFVGVEEGRYVGDVAAVEVKATRRGVKAKNFVMPMSSFARIAGIKPSMPPAYGDPENDQRLAPDFRKNEVSQEDDAAFGLR